jgi:addiction module RelE/StbE family toxin
MRELVLTPHFERAYRKFIRRNVYLQAHIENTLLQMELDVFATSLNTHKLSGELSDLYACSCGYDCRIVFSIEKEKKTGKEVIILLNIGTHDEVY